MTIQFRPATHQTGKEASPNKSKVIVLPPDTVAATSTQDATNFTIQVVNPPKSLMDPLLYAPAIPGVIVALVGLAVAHWLSGKRDRRKELVDLCSNVKATADSAATAAMKAWEVDAGSERLESVRETKRKLSILGIAVTSLAKRTAGRRCVDMSREVAQLRKAATSDPFEIPDRQASDQMRGAIMSALAEIYSKTDERFLRYAGD